MSLELIGRTNPGVLHVSRPPFVIMYFLVVGRLTNGLGLLELGCVYCQIMMYEDFCMMKHE